MAQDTVVFAVLFCFYDGQDASPCIKSWQGAQAFALSHGYEVEREA